MKCKCCGAQAQWCSEGHGNLEPHECDHIHCTHCGMHYSMETGSAGGDHETYERARELMLAAYQKNPPKQVCENHQLMQAEAKIEKLRLALIGLVGASSRQELEQMDLVLCIYGPTDENSAVALNAVRALLETE